MVAGAAVPVVGAYCLCGWKMPGLWKIPLRANAAHAMKSSMIKSMNIGNWWWAR